MTAARMGLALALIGVGAAAGILAVAWYASVRWLAAPLPVEPQSSAYVRVAGTMWDVAGWPLGLAIAAIAAAGLALAGCGAAAWPRDAR